MTGLLAGSGLRGPRMAGDALAEEGGRAAALVSPVAPLPFCAGQIVAPSIVWGATDLGIDKPLDGFVADEQPGALLREAAGDLLGRPAPCQPREDLLL